MSFTISKLHPNVWLLMFAQALIGSIGPTIVFVGGFIGLQLAPSQVLATLPVACMIVGIALFMLPTVKVLQLLGRKKGFILAVISGCLNSIFTAYTISIGHFWLFCLSVFCFGFTFASVLQFRYAAMESVDDKYAGQAVSVLLLSGLLSAFIGPEVAFIGKDLFATQYVGSFLGLTVLLTLSLLFLLFYKPIDKHHHHETEPARPLGVIVKQPLFIAALVSASVGFAVMSFIMTATPISMHVHNGFDMADTKWVIQSHIIAMYLPSFFTGKLIQRFGSVNILYAGVLILLLCILIGFAGQHYVHYWGALVLLGVGWNFMFVTSTAILPSSYRSSEKFKVQGFNDSVMFSFQALASLSAGWVIKTLGWNPLLMICLPLLLLSSFYIFKWQRSSHRIEGVS